MDLEQMRENALKGNETLKDIFNKIKENDLLNRNEKLKEITDSLMDEEEND